MLTTLLSGEYTTYTPPALSTNAQLPLLLAQLSVSVGQEVVIEPLDGTYAPWQGQWAENPQAIQGTLAGSWSLPLLLSGPSSGVAQQFVVDYAEDTHTALDLDAYDTPPKVVDVTPAESLDEALVLPIKIRILSERNDVRRLRPRRGLPMQRG